MGDAGQNISKFASSSTDASQISTSLPYISYVDLGNWLAYMVQYFQTLENDKLFAYENYASMSPYTGTYDFNILKTRSIFQYQVQKANMAFIENVKHRDVVDSYKN